jgi:hypothetical protein
VNEGPVHTKRATNIKINVSPQLTISASYFQKADSKNMKKLLLSFLLAAACWWPSHSNATIWASDGTQASIQFYNDQQLTVDGDTITVPPNASFTWTTTVQITKGITLAGGGAVSSTGGMNGVPTGSDVTTVIDHNTNLGHKLLGFSVPAGKTARLTGINFLGDGIAALTQAGMIQISGGSNCIRIDHCHFEYTAPTPGTPTTIAVYAGVTGVIDHNYFDQPSTNGPLGVYLMNGSEKGDVEWHSPDDFGTDKFIFIEDNCWRNGLYGDANTGGQRFVYRYNNMTLEDVNNQQAAYVANHGLTSGRGQSSRAYEFYKNTVTAPAPGLNKSPLPINGGTGIIWGNIETQYRYVITLDYTRKDDSTYPYVDPPNGWGNCNGTSGTVWDGLGGYPCFDQPGRGQGDLLSGNFPSIINERTGNAAQVIQALSPIYVFNNTFNPASGYSPVHVANIQCSPALVQFNREVYQQFGPYGESGTFDGTRGVGEGLLSNRPATCTTGVGYWATDTQTLYVASATNVWSVYYTPYCYPHPLARGVPAAPSNLHALSSTTVVLGWTDNSNNEDGFYIERADNSGSCGTFTQVGQVGANVTSFTDNTVVHPHKYCYRVRAFNCGSTSPYSNTITVIH